MLSRGSHDRLEAGLETALILLKKPADFLLWYDRAVTSSFAGCGIDRTAPVTDSPTRAFDRRSASQSGQDASVQFLFADYMLDTDRRELRRGAELIAVEPQVLDLLIYLVREPRSRRQQGRPDRFGLGRPHRLGRDPDQPHLRRAQGDRRQRPEPEADPHHPAQGPALRRRRYTRSRQATAAGDTAADPPSDARREAIAAGACRCPTGPPSPCFPSPT